MVLPVALITCAMTSKVSGLHCSPSINSAIAVIAALSAAVLWVAGASTTSSRVIQLATEQISSSASRTFVRAGASSSE